MVSSNSRSILREVISENLRVQKGGNSIDYIDVADALLDAKSRANHVIFARRGFGKSTTPTYCCKRDWR